MSEQRLTEVEMQLMVLQKQVEELSGELYRQSLEQEKLVRRVEELEKGAREADVVDG